MNVTLFCIFASYLVAFFFEIARLYRSRTLMALLSWCFVAAGLLAHTTYLINRSAETNLPPLLSSSHDWLLVLAWVAIVFYMFLSYVERANFLGVFVLPLVLILVGTSRFVSNEANVMFSGQRVGKFAVEAAIRNWTMIHATSLLFGIVGVLLGFVLSMMYLFQHRRLKSQLSATSRFPLPNLEKLGSLNWWTVIISVPLLTIGMVTGIILGFLSRQGPAAISFTNPNIIIVLFAWLGMVAFYLWLLKTRHPLGKQVAWMTAWAFGFLLLTIIGLQLLTGEGAHSFSTGRNEQGGLLDDTELAEKNQVDHLFLISINGGADR